LNSAANLIDTSQLLGLDNSNQNTNFNYGFGSNATNLEYSILSNMLGSPQFLDNSNSNASPNLHNTNNLWNTKNATSDTLLNTNTNASTPTSAYSNLVGDPVLYSPQQQQQLDPTTIAIAKIDQSPKSNYILSTPPASYKKSYPQRHSLSYASASKPFSYADGYHYLINYVRQK
jgi:hypothetical protein